MPSVARATNCIGEHRHRRASSRTHVFRGRVGGFATGAGPTPGAVGVSGARPLTTLSWNTSTTEGAISDQKCRQGRFVPNQTFRGWTAADQPMIRTRGDSAETSAPGCECHVFRRTAARRDVSDSIPRSSCSSWSAAASRLLLDGTFRFRRAHQFAAKRIRRGRRCRPVTHGRSTRTPPARIAKVRIRARRPHTGESPRHQSDAAGKVDTSVDTSSTIVPLTRFQARQFDS